jgi:hypothetical protein
LRVRVTLPLMDHLSIFRLREIVPSSRHPSGLRNDESQVSIGHSISELFRIIHQLG